MAEAAGERERLEFYVLGPLEVHHAGVRIALGGAQQRAVLAILLARADASVSVEQLADELWGEHPPAGFVTSVQTYVSRLRGLLEPDRPRGAPPGVLVTEAGGYALHVDGHDVDVGRFIDLATRGQRALDHREWTAASRVLSRALSLWRGDVLADLVTYPFVESFAAPLEEMRITVLENRAEAELALGHHEAVLPELRHLVEQHPLREQLRTRLMLALYRAGRQSEALATYEELRAALRDELGVDPSRPAQDLHLAILAQDPALDPEPLVIPPPPAASRAVPVPVEDVEEEDHRHRRRPGFRTAAVAAAAVVAAATTLGVGLHERTARPVVVLSPNSIGEITSNAVVRSSIRVGTNPVGLAYGAGYLWVANRSDDTVWQVDPQTQSVVQRYPVGLTPEALAVTPTDVWVANSGSSNVSRISIESMRVTRTIDVGAQPKAIAATTGAVWVALNGANTIRRIDPASDAVDDPIPVGDGPDGIAIDGDTLWVANERDGTVLHIDARTHEQVSSPFHVGAGPRGVLVSGNDVWVANALATNIWRINRVDWSSHPVDVGDGAGFLTASRDGLWVSSVYTGRLTRVDPGTERVHVYSLAGSPRGLASDGRRVWVAAGPLADRSHFGGTLTIAAQHPLALDSGIDPAEVYNQPIVAAERMVYNGLVALAYGGTDSLVLVPNLATNLPEPSNGRTTYTFTLRPGIRYSTGTLVRASDFVLGVRRALTLTYGNPGFFAGIKGGQHCIQQPDSCDVAQGVTTDDEQRRVTFHLTAPDPEFLYKLSFFVYPTPPGTPVTRVSTVPFAGTGPYLMTNVTKDLTFELHRNPFFRTWSTAAEPDGYPDVIRWLPVTDTNDAVAAVDAGRADVAWLTPLGDRRDSAALIDRLTDDHLNQLHKDVMAATGFLSLYTGMPPFDNALARRAVNYAVDRRILANLDGGSQVARPSCQVLPPGFPGQTDYCPYTSHPGDGRYHGPDLATARALVARSGTAGAHVTIASVAGDLAPPWEAYVGQVLRDLGYHVTVTERPNTQANHNWLYDPASRVQVVSGGWIADYPSPANFYDSIYRCGVPHAYPNVYCNPKIDHSATRARQLEDQEPGAALRSWGMVDRALTDDAVALFATSGYDWYYTSRRAQNFQSSQIFGPALSQIWVR